MGGNRNKLVASINKNYQKYKEASNTLRQKELALYGIASIGSILNFLYGHVVGKQLTYAVVLSLLKTLPAAFSRGVLLYPATVWYFVWAMLAFDEVSERYNAYMYTGWLENSGNWYYIDEYGALVRGWKTVNGSRYYFHHTSGVMSIGWVKINSIWYYFTSSGAMKTGWLFDGGKWYFLDKITGAMKTGWVKDGYVWYYLNNSGAMHTGWLLDGNYWYYLNSDKGGAMHTGWLNLNSKFYYLTESGRMVTGKQVIGGTSYYFDNNGVWIP